MATTTTSARRRPADPEGDRRKRSRPSELNARDGGGAASGAGRPTDDADDADDARGLQDLPCDTMATLLLLRNEFPKGLPMCRFVIKSHIYSVLSDKTTADRELDRLTRSREVLIIKLASDGDDDAVVLRSDYAAAVDAIKRRRSECQRRVLDWFASSLVGISPHSYIDERKVEHELRAFLEAIGEDADGFEAFVTLLIQSGLLKRRAGTSGGYWFSIPNVGVFVRNLVDGRRSLLSLLKRRRRGEILQWELEKFKLARSSLGSKYHIRDAIGAGFVESVPTTCGPLLRLSGFRMS